MIGEVEALFLAVDCRVVLARHPSGDGWQWHVLGDRRPTAEEWAGLEAHADAIASSETYLMWLGSDPLATSAAVALGVLPPPEDRP